MKDFLFRLGAGFRRLHREEEGVIIACSLAVFLFLYVLGCGVYALGTTIYEREALQNAADAAAYSAASIQADALSRMAMLNKALSYTYIQMSRKQMDCITAQWLHLVHNRYKEDRSWAKDWMGVLFVPKGPPPVDPWTLAHAIVNWTAANVVKGTRVKASSCSLLSNADANGWGWMCGSQGQPDVINLNGRFVSWEALQHVAGGKDIVEQILRLKELIAMDRRTITLLNQSYTTVHQEMCDSIEKSVGAVLQRNLKAVFGDEGLNEIWYSIKTPQSTWDPYSFSYQTPNDAAGTASTDAASTAASHMGYFQGMTNTESDERRFLAMSAPESASWTLPDYFVSTTIRGKRSASQGGPLISSIIGGGDSWPAAGVDQWFVRGRRDGDFYLREDGGIGFRRVFWDTNTIVRKEGLVGEATRGNHMLGGSVSIGSGLVNALLSPIINAIIGMMDVSPSVCNRKGSARKTGTSQKGNLNACTKINDSMALYAEYEWASAKWFCYGVKRKRWWKHYKCKGNHIAAPKYYCGRSHIVKSDNDSFWKYEQYADDESGTIDETKDKEEEDKWRESQGGGSASDAETGNDAEGLDEDEENIDDPEDTYVEEAPPPSPDEIAEYVRIEKASGNIPNEPNRILSTWTDVATLPIDMACAVTGGEPRSKAGKHIFDLLGIVRIGSGEEHDHHGYADWTSGKTFSGGNDGTLIAEVFSALKRQMEMNLKDSAIPRAEYRSCAMGVYATNGNDSNLWLRGFARIYGDDEEILDPRVYEGANPRPWILSERFFGPDGTITVAVAKRRRNPWMQLLGDAVESVRSLYSVGNPAGKNEATGTYMWALSSGRAAFRDPVDGTLQGSYRYLNKERQHDGLGDFEPGESGCVCDTAPARLERQWNLCVTEWEPTLVPVAMADAFRAVEDQFVANPQQETSGLAKLLYLDFVDDGTIQRDEGDEAGWLPLSGEGDPKKSDDFLRVAVPGSGDGPTFGPEDKADWPKTLWPRKIL